MSVSVIVKASMRRFWLASAISLSASVAMGTGVEWNTNLREGAKQSQETGKPLLIYFYSDANTKSKACDASTFADPSVGQIVKSNFVPIKINASEAPATARHYQASNETDLPLVLLVGADGKEKSRFAVSDKPTEFLAQTIPHLGGSSSATAANAQNKSSTNEPSASAPAVSALTTMPALNAPTVGLSDMKAMASTAKQSANDLTKSVTNQTPLATQSALGQLTQTFDATKQSVGQQFDATKQVVTHQADAAKQQFDTAKQNATQQLAAAKNALTEQATALTGNVGTQASQLVGNGASVVGQGVSQFSNNLSAGGNNLLAKAQSAVPQLGTQQPGAEQAPYSAPVSSPFNAIGVNQPVAQIASAAKVEPPTYSKVGSIYDPGYMPKVSNGTTAGIAPYNAPLPANSVTNPAATPVLPSNTATLPVIGAQVATSNAASAMPIASGYANGFPQQPVQQPQYNQQSQFPQQPQFNQQPAQQFSQLPQQSALPPSPTTAAEKASKLAELYPKKEVKPISAYSTENYEKYMVEKAGVNVSSNPATSQTSILPGMPSQSAPTQNAQSQSNPILPPQSGFMPPAAASTNVVPGYSQPQANVASAKPAGNLPQNIGLDGFCPVHLREGKAWKKGDPRFGANHRGRVYLFASEDAQKRFMANPDYYSPAMGGNDPVAIFSKGQYVAGKREYGMVLGERLYLFADPASRDEMIKNQQSYISAIQLAERTAGGNIVR